MVGKVNEREKQIIAKD